MRQSGILLAVSSLPGRHGIGDFGPEAYKFARLAKRGGFRIWQVLPLNPLGYGHSPYQPFSSKAMDEIYISLDVLVKEKLLGKVPGFNKKAGKVEYEQVREFKEKYLKKAFGKFVPSSSYYAFLKNNPWVVRYALFITLKKKNNLVIWTDWPEKDKNIIKDFRIPEEHKEQIEYELFIQYKLFQQWMRLKKYVNKLGLKIVGDIPIYVGIDSEDVWSNQSQFLLDRDGNPTFIAGVPPDYFSPTGQRWGNPLYDWDVMAKDGYAFWIDRLRYNAAMYDYVRIDHFRGFDTYWKIPVSCPTAVEGAWILGPAYKLFDEVFAKLPNLHILAEDLGDLRPEVLLLRDHYRLPGMIITQFVFPFHEKTKFDYESTVNAIAMTGSHDNQTTMGWWTNFTPVQKKGIRKYLIGKGLEFTDIARTLVEYTLSLAADYAIIPIQDLLCLSDKARMNKPGIIDDINWTWRLSSFASFAKEIARIRKLNRKYRR